MSINIIISKEPQNRLYKVGRKEQTYDDIITELLSQLSISKPTEQESNKVNK